MADLGIFFLRRSYLIYIYTIYCIQIIWEVCSSDFFFFWATPYRTMFPSANLFQPLLRRIMEYLYSLPISCTPIFWRKATEIKIPAIFNISGIGNHWFLPPKISPFPGFSGISPRNKHPKSTHFPEKMWTRMRHLYAVRGGGGGRGGPRVFA